MADKRIHDFKTLTSADDDALILVSKDSETHNIAYGTLRQELQQDADEAARRANESAANADISADRANNAAEQAERVNIRASQTATGADITVTGRGGEETTVHIDTLFAVNSWADIRNAVRLGLGPKLFPVGYEFTVHNSDYDYDTIWRVVGHDHHKAANRALEHTMTLEMKHVLSNSGGSYVNLQYDAPEAFYYAKDGLRAGTYNFTWDYTSGSMISGTYQFTLTRDIPSGGQIVIGTSGTDKAITDCMISTYGSVGADKAIESNIAITAGSGGTSLGTLAKDTSSDENLNTVQRIASGSDNYAQSAVDQLLNSSSEAGSVWEAATKFDRPPSWNTAQNGFMHGLPADFLEAVQPAEIPCRTNNYFEIENLDGTEFAAGQVYTLVRKFFLLSRPEVYGTYDSSSLKDGEILEYYEGASGAERIHRDRNDSARSAWLRSAPPGNTNQTYIITASGSMTSSFDRSSAAVAAACIIA